MSVELMGVELRECWGLFRNGVDHHLIAMRDGGDAVPVFTDKAKARAFRGGSHPNTRRYRVTRLSLTDLFTLLRECMLDGITWVAFDPTALGPDGKATTKYMLILEFLAEAEDE